MPHVFVSYVHEDNDKVDRLCSDLRSHGVKVWRASEKIDPGERWERAIKKAIKGGAFFIACFSRNYQKKDQSYMNKELNLAIKALSLRPLDKRWFIPVSFDGCEIPDLSIRHDETLRSLQKESGTKIFKVFNVFHDRYRPDEDELDSGIRNIFIQAKDRLRKAGLKDCDEWIIVDAKSGSGMEAFVESFADSLPVEALKNLANTLKREYAHVIQRKIDEHYLDFLAQITALVAVFPADHSAGRERLLNLALDSLMTVAEFMSPEKEAREARPLVLQIIGQIESKSTRRTYDRVKQYRWREMPKFISDFFGLYEWKNVKVDEYYGVGGINAIRLVLALGLAVRELFRGHPADRLESLLQSSRMRIERAVDGNADSINRVTRTAGRQFEKDTRIQLSEELYPLIRQILTEELGSHTPS